MAEEKTKEARMSLKRAQDMARRLRASALFTVFGSLVFYMMGASGRFRVRPHTSVAPRGVADLTWPDIKRALLGSHFGVIPPTVARILIEVTGMLPIRGKMLVPWLGTRLEALTASYKGAVGYLPALFSAIQPDGWCEGALCWASRLTTTKSGKPLCTDGAGWYVLYDQEDQSTLQKLGEGQYAMQIRLLAPAQLGLGKGLLYPCHWKHLPSPLKKKVKSLLARRQKGENVELPVAIIDREQFKAGGRFRTSEKAQALGLAAEYAEFADFAQAAIDAFEALEVGQDFLGFRGNLGVMAVMRPDVMKLGPQLTLRVVRGAEDLYIKILKRNWEKFVSQEGGPLKAIYQSTIDGDETGECQRASLLGSALGFSQEEIYKIPSLAFQAQARLLKKLYRFGCSMGMSGLSAPLIIAHNIGLDKLAEGEIRGVVLPERWFKQGKVQHGQKVVFGRYPVAAFDVSGATVYRALSAAELPPEVLAEAPWLRYSQSIVGDLLAIVQDVTGDDDGDRGFVITDPDFVEAFERYPVTLPGGKRRRFCIEGYEVNKTQAKAPGREHLVALSQDATGPVGVYTKCQDALLRIFAGFGNGSWQGTQVHPRAQAGVYWAMGAMSFMVQCAVDSKKNIIPVYRWWRLTREDAWTTEFDTKLGVELTKPSKRFIASEKVGPSDRNGFGKVTTRKGWSYRHRGSGWQEEGAILREDGALAIPAVFAWLKQMVFETTGLDVQSSEGSLLEVLLPWDSKDRKTPISHFRKDFAVEEIHPLDHSYNVFLALVREQNFPKWLISDEKPRLGSATHAIVAKLGIVPVSYEVRGEYLVGEGEKLLQQCGWADVMKTITSASEHKKELGSGESARAVSEFYDSQIAAVKEAAKEAVSKLSAEQLVGLHEALCSIGKEEAAWGLLVLCDNALTRALGLPQDPTCSFIAENADEFRKIIEEQSRFDLEGDIDAFTHVAQVLNGIEVTEVKDGEVLLRETSETFAGRHPEGDLARCPHCSKWVHHHLMAKHRARMVQGSTILAWATEVNDRLNVVAVKETGELIGRAADKGRVKLLDKKLVPMSFDWHFPVQEQIRKELLAAGISEEFLLSDRERRAIDLKKRFERREISKETLQKLLKVNDQEMSDAQWRKHLKAHI